MFSYPHRFTGSSQGLSVFIKAADMGQRLTERSERELFYFKTDFYLETFFFLPPVCVMIAQK